MSDSTERRRWRNAASEYVRTGLEQFARNEKVLLDERDPSRRKLNDPRIDKLAVMLLREFLDRVQYLPHQSWDWRVQLELTTGGTNLSIRIPDAVLDAEDCNE